MLRVVFSQTCIVRLLDEFYLSTEDGAGDKVGLIPNHFAYRVEGARLRQDESLVWKTSNLDHYQFVTGSTCLDVLCGGTPKFMVVPR